MDKTLLLRWLLAPLAVLALAWARDARAADADLPLGEQVRQMVTSTFHAEGTDTPAQPRMDVIVGPLDARLRLAPCQQVQAFVPTGVRLWGRTRVGLRCVKGVTLWTVYMPVTVNVYGRAMVATASLPAGHVLEAADFREAEVNLTEDLTNPLVTDAAALAGRGLVKAVAPGQSLRQNSLKQRQWFAAGDTVQIRAVGSGFAVAGSGEAVTAGLEGLPARVRMETGRIVSGMPVGDRQLDVAL